MSVTSSVSGLGRWLKPLLADLPGLAVVDAHTHIGADSDGMVCDQARLQASLAPLAARAVTFPLHVESGYERDNDAVIASAAESDGMLVPFCRLDPHDSPLIEGERAIAAGARGIKLHPRAENFTLAHPGVEDVLALADAHALPVLIHAGIGIDPLGADALRLAGAHPRATLILAHAAITDLAWIGDALDDHPNVLFDTAWWNAVDLLALFSRVPPGRILFGSDMPYGDPSLNALITLRCAQSTGLDEDQIRSVMGGQLERLLAGESLTDLGPALGGTDCRPDVLLDRATTYIAAAWGNALAGGTAEVPLELARMALEVSPTNAHRAICDAAIEALDMPPNGPLGLGGLAIAAAIVATPNVPVA